MNIWKKCLYCFALSGLLSGCLPAQQQMNMEQDLDEMKRRLAFVERKITSESLDIKDETGRSLTAFTKRQADMEANMDNLRVELQTLEGRLEEVIRENRQLRDELNLTRDDLSLKTADLEDRLSAKKATKVSSTPKKSPPPVAVETKPEDIRQEGPPPAAVEAKPEDLYKEGLILIRDKQKFAESRKVFQKFLKDYPNHHLAVNAMYWIGEAYYGDKQYENAILQFQDVIQKYSNHPKAASALYKQALAFNAMGDKKNAQVLLEKLIQAYPESPEAALAKKTLTDWK